MIDILDDDASCHSERVDQGTTVAHQRMEKGTRDEVDLGDGGFGKKSAAGSRVASSFCLVPPPGGAVSGVMSTQLRSDGVYRP